MSKMFPQSSGEKLEINCSIQAEEIESNQKLSKHAKSILNARLKSFAFGGN